MYIYVYTVYTCVCIYAYIYIYTYTHTHTHTHTHIQTHTHTNTLTHSHKHTYNNILFRSWCLDISEEDPPHMTRRNNHWYNAFAMIDFRSWCAWWCDAKYDDVTLVQCDDWFYIIIKIKKVDIIWCG